MSSVFLSGFNLIALVLLLLPGLIGEKVALLVDDRADQFNRLDTIAISFVISLTSLLLLYIISHGFENRLVSYDILLSNYVELPRAIWIYLLMIIFSSLIGLCLGSIEFGGDLISSRTGLWYKTVSKIEDLERNEEERYQIRVMTKTGNEIWGRVTKENSFSSTRDIHLTNPRMIHEGDDRDRDRNFSGSIYIHRDSIAHVEIDQLSSADRSVGQEKGGQEDMESEMESLRKNAPNKTASDEGSDLPEGKEETPDDTSDSPDETQNPTD